MQLPENFKLTPMYEQYLRIKEDYPDTILFYRMGDFYELFFHDAEIAAKELQLALTSRHQGEFVPMCGIPWHAADAYFSQMVEKGYKVAICDQVEDPKTAKGLVKREVTKILTAGTIIDDANLESKLHIFLGAAFWQENAGAFAWLDVSTGAWTGVQVSKESELWQWVYKVDPKELLVASGMEIPELVKINGAVQLVYLNAASHFDLKRSEKRILDVQKVQELSALGLERKPALVRVCGAIVAYLEQTQKYVPSYLSAFEPLDMGKFMVIDEVTERNLEIFRRYDGKKGIGTLWHELDFCQTPMGGRLLEERLRYPYKDIARILVHQDVVSHFFDNPKKLQALRGFLGKIYDLERLSTRISVNRFLPKDFLALRDSLAFLSDIFNVLRQEDDALPTDKSLTFENVPEGLGRLLKKWDSCADIHTLLSESLLDVVPQQITEGMLFKAGYHAELDELIDIMEHGESRLQALLAHEQEKSDLPKLKMGYNRVFGYYFELSRAQQQPVPDYFERRQSLVNAERFVTPELKELESKLISASEKRNELEYRLFQELRVKIAEERPRLLFMAGLIAQIDYWQALAECARKKEWTKPVLDEGNDIEIKDGRHPVVEAVIGKSHFIPNDLIVNEKKRLLLITGPNMAGKSTVLRQSALICMLAQMGAFVPAAFAKIGIVDRIFSRVGASDNISQGQSTFMVEMMETARILRQATKKSFVILDEIGRGTSTFDGLALAWAVMEELLKRANGQVRTLFATHYHELTALENKFSGIFNMNIAIKEWNNDIVFLRKLIPGPADKSYGIEVARLAGVPAHVVHRAKELLVLLEENKEKSEKRVERVLLPGVADFENSEDKTNAFHKERETVANTAELVENALKENPILKELAEINLNTLTPLDCMRLLFEWKEKL